MTAPTPDTRTAIVLLNGSRVRPNGTWKTPLIPIHVNSAAAVVCCAKIKQLQAKLTSTATIEIELLNVFNRRVNSVITDALTNGASRMSHGNFGSRHRDNEKDKHLRVVIGQAVWIETESRESNEGQVCRIQHQLQ